MSKHDEGLARDLDALGRRRVLLGGAGLAATTLLAAWASDFGYSGLFPDGGRGAATPASGVGPDGVCLESAQETEGPYPADGSNTATSGRVANILGTAGLMRSDIRASFGGARGIAAGVPVTLRLKLVQVNAACASLVGRAIYLWHCSREGEYSIYDQPAQNWLRGLQETDAAGQVVFHTVFPGCYAGRMPHMHVEVYRNATSATSFARKLATTQIAFPVDVCHAVYARPGYERSVANFAQISFATDMVFADGTQTEMAAVAGSVASGLDITLQLGIEA